MVNIRQMKRYLVLAACFLCMLQVGAVTGYRSITMDDGLPANTVRNVVQDKYGFIWLGTDNGLCRYDGMRVQSYHIDEVGANQYISALTVDDQGLYVGTERGVFHFCLEQGRFERLPLDILSTVTSLTEDKEQNLWVATIEQGAWCYDRKTGNVRHFEFNNINGAVTQLLVDKDNQVWALTNRKTPVVQRLNRLHDTFEAVTLQTSLDARGLALLQTRDGRMWIGSWNDGLFLLHDDGRAEQVLSPAESKVGSHIHTLYQWKDDCICIGCDDGVICFNPATRQWHRLFEETTASLSDRFVYDIASDNEGGLWIGTFYGGVNYVSPVDRRFEAGLQGNIISRICEDDQQRLWMASDNGGLICHDPSRHLTLDYPHRDALGKRNMHALYHDGQRLWAGTYTDGVYTLEPTGRLQHYTTTSSPNSLDNNSSYAIYRDRGDRIWVATMEGLNLYHPDNDHFTRVVKLNCMTIDIDEDADHNLWLSTEGGGLWRYHPGKKTLKHFHHIEGDSLSLPDNHVNCAYIDGSGQLWIGTFSGLCRYRASDETFHRISLVVPNQNVMSIIEDQGSLWLSTERGIVKYTPNGGVQHFTRHDGLPSEQFQPNAGLKTADGRIYFGTTNGYCTFLPYQIKINKVMPPVYVTEVSWGYENRASERTRVLPAEIELSYGDARMLNLTFASLSYCLPEKNQYAYRMEGFDSDWNYVGNQHRATYTNLPAGTYVFRVCATNNDGEWSDCQAALRIVVHPPLWWSWWAKTLYLLLVIALIWYYVRFRLKRAEHRHKRELQRLSEQKEREVREARLNFFTTIAHEIRTPVSLIIAPLEELKASHSSDTTHLDVIDRNAHRLLELVNQLLDFRKVEQQSLTVSFAPENVYDLLHAVCERFAPTFAQGDKQFDVVYPDSHFTAIIDREGVTKVVSNLLTNANKYAKSHVQLSCIVEADGEHFRIEVSDDGTGISPADQARIFEPFFQAQTSKPGTGIGLSIVKTLVGLHHGQVGVESEEGHGSRFIVTLPVKQEMQQRDEDTTLPLSESKADSPQHATTGSKESILLVEDDPDMLAFLASHFTDHYQVLTATNGVEGLRQLATHAVTLIVSDWMMPGMDGAEFCRRVRANGETSHIPLILLTAKTDDDSKAEGMDIGADAYLEKPFSLKVLDACLRNLITRRRELMARFAQEPDQPIAPLANNAVDNEFLTRMNTIIEANIANSDFNVNILAEQMNISRSGLFAKIKAIADVTPNEMIQVVRLKRAAQLLSQGRYRVSEVSYKVGFSSPSYFAKCFQRQFGKRPGEMVG